MELGLLLPLMLTFCLPALGDISDFIKVTAKHVTWLAPLSLQASKAITLDPCRPSLVGIEAFFNY
jgi:hypothetical protein